MYLQLIELALSLGGTLVSTLTKAKAPAEIIASTSAAVGALQAHYSDEVTKANLEAQRG